MRDLRSKIQGVSLSSFPFKLNLQTRPIGQRSNWKILPLAVSLHQAMAGKEMELEQIQTIMMRYAALLSLILVG